MNQSKHISALAGALALALAGPAHAQTPTWTYEGTTITGTQQVVGGAAPTGGTSATDGTNIANDYGTGGSLAVPSGDRLSATGAFTATFLCTNLGPSTRPTGTVYEPVNLTASATGVPQGDTSATATADATTTTTVSGDDAISVTENTNAVISGSAATYSTSLGGWVVTTPAIDMSVNVGSDGTGSCQADFSSSMTGVSGGSSPQWAFQQLTGNGSLGGNGNGASTWSQTLTYAHGSNTYSYSGGPAPYPVDINFTAFYRCYFINKNPPTKKPFGVVPTSFAMTGYVDQANTFSVQIGSTMGTAYSGNNGASVGLNVNDYPIRGSQATYSTSLGGWVMVDLLPEIQGYADAIGEPGEDANPVSSWSCSYQSGGY